MNHLNESIKLIKNIFQFQEIREIIARYDTLTVTHQDLFEREAKNQEKYEQEKARLMKFTEVMKQFSLKSLPNFEIYFN
jgi:thioredoxin-related protein